MMQKQNNEDFLNSIVGIQANRTLTDNSTELALIQAASVLALEGTSRATATQIADKAIDLYKVDVIPSFAGHVFSSLDIPTVTSHGKSRFVLEYDDLEKIRNTIVSRCEEAKIKLKSAIERFQHLPQRMTELQKTWQEILNARAKEQELIRTINEDRRTPSRLEYLEKEAEKIRAEAAKVKEIEDECQSLLSKIKKLPSLEDKNQKLRIQFAKYEERLKVLIENEREINRQEEAVAKREAVLSNRITKLEKRLDWLKLGSLDEAIESAKKELDSLSKQLGEKRSLLDKVLGRNKEGDR